MKNKVFLGAVVLLVAVLLFSIVTRIDKLERAAVGEIGVAAVTDCIEDPHNHGFNSDCNSLFMNGKDLTFYSGASGVGETIKLEGTVGTITATNGVFDSVTAATLVSQTVVLDVVNGVTVAGNVTMTEGAILNTNGAVTITDQLLVTSEIDGSNGLALTGNLTVTGAGSFSSQLTASNGVAATGNVTVGTDLDVAGNIFSTSGSVRINDPLIVTGSLLVAGNVADSGTQSLRLNDDVLLTGTLNATGVATFNSTVRADSLLTAANGIAVTRGVTVTGNVTATAMMQVGTWGMYQPQTAIAVTNDSYITPTGTYQPLSLAADCGTAHISAMPVGYLLILKNDSAFTVSITDTATIMLSASWSGSQYDTLTLISDGTNWLELARSVN